MSAVGRGVVKRLKAAPPHAREIQLTGRQNHVPGPVNVNEIRTTQRLSQSQFAKRFGFSVRTLQDWELGRVQPPSAVRAYLTVIDRFPDTVEKALLGAA
jgi:putative transcriptional regulator